MKQYLVIVLLITSLILTTSYQNLEVGTDDITNLDLIFDLDLINDDLVSPFYGSSDFTTNGTHVVVLDTLKDTILIFDINGNFQKQFGYTGTTFNDSLSNPQGIEMNSSHILVGNSGKIKIFDLAGNYISEFGNGIGSGNGQFQFIQDIKMNTTHILVSDSQRDDIQVFEHDGDYVSTIGGPGVVDGTFDDLRDIHLNATHIFAADSVRDNIQIFDLAGNFVTKFGTSGTGDSQFQLITDIKITNNEILILDAVRGDIQIFDLTGTYLDKFGNFGSNDGEFGSPSEMVVINQDLLVLDLVRYDVQRFDSSNAFVYKFGNSYLDNGASPEATDLSTNSTHYFLLDDAREDVQVFDLAGNYQYNFAGGGQLSAPTAIATNTTHVFITDTNVAQILLYYINGTFIQNAVSTGIPGDIVINSTHYSMIDISSNLIVIFDLAGNPVDSFGGTGTGNGQFTQAKRIEMNDKNYFVLDEITGNIQVFDLAGNYIATFGSGILNSPKNLELVENYVLVDDIDYGYKIFNAQTFEFERSYGDHSLFNQNLKGSIVSEVNTTHLIVYDKTTNNFLFINYENLLAPTFSESYGSNWLNLMWDDISTEIPIVEYDLYRSFLPDEGYVKIGSTSTSSYNDTTISPNQIVYYRFIAKTLTDETEFSDFYVTKLPEAVNETVTITSTNSGPTIIETTTETFITTVFSSISPTADDDSQTENGVLNFSVSLFFFSMLLTYVVTKKNRRLKTNR